LVSSGIAPAALEEPALIVEGGQELRVMRNLLGAVGDLPGLGAEVGRRARRRGTSARVRARLLERPDVKPTMAMVASDLHLEERTLRRHLGAEGTSFSELLDEVHETLATQLLALPSMTVEEVARRLGYADGPTFSHAFRRWTGASPRPERRRQPSTDRSSASATATGAGPSPAMCWCRRGRRRAQTREVPDERRDPESGGCPGRGGTGCGRRRLWDAGLAGNPGVGRRAGGRAGAERRESPGWGRLGG
jgi:AraC-like DNA-binding protein